MARQRCCGIIDFMPCCRRFTADDRDAAATVTVTLEEIEAIRLKDQLGYDQMECAASMGLSRATFQRILRSARHKVATALIEGHHIVFEGGNYQMRDRTFECIDCGKRWTEQPCSAGGKHGYEIACPHCGSMKKMKINEEGTKTMCGGHHGHNHGQGGCCGGH